MKPEQKKKPFREWKKYIRILIDIFFICFCFYGFSKLLDNCSPGCGLYATQYYDWGRATHEIVERNSCSNIYIGNHYNKENKSMEYNKIVCIKRECKDGSYCKLDSITLD